MISLAYLSCPATQPRISFDMPNSALGSKNSGFLPFLSQSELWMWQLEPARS
ncbi:hypothetical protein D9M71_554990 [compost metagenome]